MSRSYWRYIAAVVGWLILSGVVLFSLYPEQPHLTGNSGFQKEQSGYRAGGYDCQPAQMDKLPERKRARRAVTCQEAEEQHRLQVNDLIQQRRAADAADASSIFAFQQTRIGALGVVVGLTTLMAAIAAAYYARHAAIETKRSADASVLSLRPWLDVSATIEGVSLIKSGLEVRVVIKITNCGTIPASNIRTSACGHLLDVGDSTDFAAILQRRDSRILADIETVDDKTRTAITEGRGLFPPDIMVVHYEAKMIGKTGGTYSGWLVVGVAYSFPGGEGQTIKVLQARYLEVPNHTGFDSIGEFGQTYTDCNVPLQVWPEMGRIT